MNVSKAILGDRTAAAGCLRSLELDRTVDLGTHMAVLKDRGVSAR